MVRALPSKKPRFDGRLEIDVAEKADALCDAKGWSRGRLVKEAIAQYISANSVLVPLKEEDKERLNALADKHNRPIEYEGLHAILRYLAEEEKDES